MPPAKVSKGPSAEESVFALASKPAANPVRNSYELEPIENYKGKSVAELEAILDAHNAHQKQKNSPAVANEPPMQE